MGFWDSIFRSPASVDVFTPNVTHLGADEFGYLSVGDMTPVQMWETQPHLRTVVSFLARNIAQLGIHCFERDGDDRKRDRTSPLALALSRPNSSQTTYDLVYALVGDKSLVERAYWHVAVNDDGRYEIRRLPPMWVSPKWSNAFDVDHYDVTYPDGRGSVEIPADQILSFTGYHPSSLRKGSPTIESLKATLNEQIESSRYRAQVWKRGGRVSSVLERPKDAPEWSDAARDSFREDWYSKYTGKGPKAGGTPILEDGMTLKRIDFNAQEQQFVEATKLSFATVAAAFHVNPTMVGILDNANYSNVREFRRMLYGDTLGPMLAEIEGRLNAFLLPMMGMDNSTHFVEFNIAEKLQGSFEEQASVMSTMVGAPLMTRDEGRAKFNLPKIDGGDQLVTPLNVLIGGQASPTDSGTQNLNARRAGTKSTPVRFKATDLGGDEYVPDAEKLLADFFTRQERVVRSVLGSKADEDYFDEDRWNDELADDLYALAVTASTQMGRAQAVALGFRAGDYDVESTTAFLRSVATRRAEMVNATTLDRIKTAIDSDATVGSVFDEARSARAGSGATALMTALSGFALIEATKQTTGDRASKEWVVNSSNPRSEHAAMGGEQVGLDEAFSNGAMWPGDTVLGAAGVANCQCTTDVILP